MNVFIDPRFEPLYDAHPIVLVDVGARGGLKQDWLPAKRHLRMIGFEPDVREYEQLTERLSSGNTSQIYFNTALHNRRGPITLHVARDRGLSSIFEPNRDFLAGFPDANRFDQIDLQQVEADTLDHVLSANGVGDVDFVKADTQGSELFVLEGAVNTLSTSVVGIEVEVEFAPIYKGQPLFADVDRFLQGLGYHLFDLRPCYWKRAAGRAIGGPRGQMIWADALYLRGLPQFRSSVGGLDRDVRKSKVLRAISISVLYGYFDYALAIAEHAGDALQPDERTTIVTRLRKGGTDRGRRFPGRRQLSAALHRLWRISVERDDSWSVSSAKLGNQE